MKAYYNEIEPFAAAWLKELIAKGQLPDGDIDTRSIEDVQPGDLAGYSDCHFFAGIGGWAYALRLAGVEGRGIWTGSCPCQPFSVAGKGKGTDDERHLWPEFYRLISQCQPAKVFGEQVASPLGRSWLASVFADLEDVGYKSGGPVAEAGGNGVWARADYIECLDGKARPVEPGIFPVANGFPGRVGTLRGSGNAIVPQVAEVFVRAALEAV